MEDENSMEKCYFCSVKKGIYTCPRCSSLYCSIPCYQSDNHLDCSEEFYKEWIGTQIEQDAGDPESKKQMLEILSRVENSENILSDEKDSDDGDSVADLSERMKDVDLNNGEEIWNHLTEDEKSDFQAIVKSGNIDHLVPVYEPWWSKRYDKKVEELDAFLNKENEKHYSSLCPNIKRAPVPLKNLSQKSPSPTVLYNIANVLAAYAFTVRYHNGDYHHEAIDATNLIFSLSTNLNADEVFESMELALESVMYHIVNTASLTCSKNEASIVEKDVRDILTGPEKMNFTFYILSALSDLQTLFSNALHHQKDFKAETGNFSAKFPVSSNPITNEAKVRRSMKKLDFFSSWVNDCYHPSLNI